MNIHAIKIHLTMKNNIAIGFLILLAVALTGFNLRLKATPSTLIEQQKEGTETLYFAGGCFWGTEHFFKQINGVISSQSGYANGNISNPTYKKVVNGDTGFAEAVKVVYNPKVVTPELLLDLYFKSIDPTSLNRQGNDIGTQYRTGIYYTDEKYKPIIEKAINSLKKQYKKPIVIEVEKLRKFYLAEEYHQNYLDKNPQGYCHIPTALFEYAKKANEVKPTVKR